MKRILEQPLRCSHVLRRKWFSVKAVFQQPLVAKCCMAYAGEYDCQECGGTALRDRAWGVAKKLLAAVNYQEKVHPEGGDLLNACPFA